VSEERKRGVSWLVLLGLLLIGMGIMIILGLEWFPAILIILGVIFVAWGLMSRAGLVEEKE